jgi:hypothetical protein
MFLTISLMGCARAGFFESTDSDDGPRADTTRIDHAVGSPDLRRGDGTPAGEALPTSHPHDTCATPSVVDLTQAPLKIPVDVTGAANNHKLACCGARPDIVFRLEKPGGKQFKRRCAGGGTMAVNGPSLLCPPALPLCSDLKCDGVQTSSFSTDVEVMYLIVCRDPAQGYAELSITLE